MNNFVADFDKNEKLTLCKFAQFSADTKGREKIEDKSDNDFRTPFMRDRDRIIHSKAFRRLMHKTQCFLSPEGDHYRTRLTHTLEVSQISRTIARALRLNEDLTEAIALAHDLGHTPFGHAGERVLNKLCPLGFSHNHQSLRVVDILERDGNGLNLSFEVRNGIVCHTGDTLSKTAEGNIIRIADRIAYINHDIDDAVRAGVLKNTDIPKDLREILGETHSQRIDVMVKSVISKSRENFEKDINEISMDKEISDATLLLRDFLFESVYFNPVAKSEETKACEMLTKLYEYYFENQDKIPEEYKKYIDKGENVHRVVCDYIGCMTDRYALQTFNNLFIPKNWSII